MTVDMLVDALGEVDSSYIVLAEELTPRRTGRSLRRAGLIALAAALALTLTLVTAMAVSVEVREAVFGFFKLPIAVDVDRERESLDAQATSPGGPGAREPGDSVGSFTVTEGASMESYRLEGYCDVWRGVVIFNPNRPDQWWINTAYAVPKGGMLREMTDWHEVNVTARGVDVSFRWSGLDGVLAVHTPYQDPGVREDFPLYSVFTKENVRDRIFIDIYDGRPFPAVYDIRTGEVTEPFAGIDWPSEKYVNSENIRFTSDLRYAVFSEGLMLSESGDELYLADLETRAVHAMSEVCGLERVNEAWFYGDGTLICCSLSRDHRLDYRTVDLATGNITAPVSGAPLAHRDVSSGQETPELEYWYALTGRTYAGVGEDEGIIMVSGSRAVLWRDKGGDVSAVDLITGERWLLPGISDRDGDLKFAASPQGDKLFDTLAGEGMDALSSVCVLDVERHRVCLLTRAGTAEYTMCGWLDDDRVYFLTDPHYDRDDNGSYPHEYMYVYELK